MPRRLWSLATLCLLSPLLLLRGAPQERRNSPKPGSQIELRQPGHDPSIGWDAEGRLHMLFVREDNSKQRLFHVRSGSDAKPSAVTPASSPDVDGRAETSLAILPNGTLVAAYSVALPGGHKIGLRAQRSIDGGATWSEPATVNDVVSGYNAFVSTAVDGSGQLLIAWLDNRTGHQGLVMARSRDGLRFTPNKTVDPRTCQCCSTALAADRSGAFWIAYRDLEGKDLRDIAVVHGESSKAEIDRPVKVSNDGWHVNGCPESGPRLALEGNGTLWAAWFTGAAPGVFAAFSGDGGKTFSRRFTLAGASDQTGLPNHPEIAALPDGRIAALYEAHASIFARVLRPDRSGWGEPALLVEQATHAHVASRSGKSALSFTGRAGNDTVAVATTAPLARLAGPAR